MAFAGTIAVPGELGLEATPDAYVAAMAQVFREVWRVLRPEGTLWLNMGDSYASGEIGRHDGYNPTRANGSTTHKPFGIRQQQRLLTRLPAKNLLGMPWRVALALQADGWILRSEIIWDKPSCMPESVQDRPTRSHEYVFLFSKAPRYFYDADAVREPMTGHGSRWRTGMPCDDADNGPKHLAKVRDGIHGFGSFPHGPHPAGRNARSVWRIASESTSFAHFATFPQALVRRCLLAGAPSQVCAACGAPWKREVKRTAMLIRRSDYAVLSGNRTAASGTMLAPATSHTTGFAPTCPCAAGTQPATVLDPFCGSGTTLLVARELGHHAIGVDLSWPYLHDIARQHLGLAALDAWQHGQEAQPVHYADLPLFGGAP